MSMGGIAKEAIEQEVLALVNKWERTSIDSMYLDGPLDYYPKLKLISMFMDLLAEKCETMHYPVQPAEVARRGRGRPRNVNQHD